MGQNSKIAVLGLLLIPLALMVGCNDFKNDKKNVGSSTPAALTGTNVVEGSVNCGSRIMPEYATDLYPVSYGGGTITLEGSFILYEITDLGWRYYNQYNVAMEHPSGNPNFVGRSGVNGTCGFSATVTSKCDTSNCSTYFLITELHYKGQRYAQIGEMYKDGSKYKQTTRWPSEWFSKLDDLVAFLRD